MLYDADGNKLVPHHVNKKGHRYHYYVSQRLKTGDQDSGWRIPAKTIEQTVKDSLISLLKSDARVLELLDLENPSAEQLQSLSRDTKALSEQIQARDHLALKKVYNKLITALHVHSDKLMITLNLNGLSHKLKIESQSEQDRVLTLPMTIRRRGQEMKMVIGGEQLATSNPDDALIMLVAKAHLLKVKLQNGTVSSIKGFAEQHGMDHGDAKNLVPLGYLAPSILEDILAGRQPIDLTARRLKYLSNLPVSWTEQRSFLGFT